MVFHTDPLFFRSSIGFDDLVTRINKIQNNMDGNTTYPPYNLYKIADQELFVIEMAIAGFKRSEVKIHVKDGGLYIEGKKTDVQDGIEEYYHKGLATREFSRAFTLAEHVEVVEAEFTDGILKVTLEKRIPEALKPREIEIK